jgi:hypothetical protein
LKDVSENEPSIFTQTITVVPPDEDHSPEFLDQLQNMELSRQLDREARIKATMDLRQLRGEDDDNDMDGIKALEQIEIEKINLQKLKIAK